MVSTSQKINCPLARISSFFENYFPTNSNSGFYQQKNSCHKKHCFHQTENPVSTSRQKNLLKNAFRLYGKVASILKNLKIPENIEKTGVHQQEYIFVFKNRLSPSFNNSFHQQKKLGKKHYCFQQIKNSFPLAGMKGWLKNIQLKNELFPLAAVDCCLKKMEENGFHQPENQFSLV